MTTIKSFVERLAKIGIKVKGNYLGEHGFTVFFTAVKVGQVGSITNISIIFKKIRETLKTQIV